MYHLAKYTKEVDIEGILLGENNHEHHHEPDQEGAVSHGELGHLPGHRSGKRQSDEMFLWLTHLPVHLDVLAKHRNPPNHDEHLNPKEKGGNASKVVFPTANF